MFALLFNMLAVQREHTHDYCAVIGLWGFIMFRMMMVTALAVGLLAFEASAFEQTTVVPKPVTSAAEQSESLPSEGTVELTVPDAEETKQSGPTISLPGLGAIGTLPKFDFGLELLYGEDSQGTVVEEDTTEGDLRIRGSVKHKF